MAALAQSINEPTSKGGYLRREEPNAASIQFIIQNAVDQWLAQHSDQKLLLVGRPPYAPTLSRNFC
ncbi:hypothetical protein KFU94_46050 [Chloroflexi bacterium TSY]|nr:hypothetical protein [Chloroflexi bacterium TSY]